MMGIIIQKRNDKIVELYNEGFNFNEISKMFNVSHTTIMRIIKKNLS